MYFKLLFGLLNQLFILATFLFKISLTFLQETTETLYKYCHFKTLLYRQIPNIITNFLK